MRNSLLSIFLLIIISLPAHAEKAAWVIDINGAIGPATADMIIRGIDQAEAANANLFVIRLDTPGGLDKSMRSIIKKMLAAKIPIVTFVAPSGARAASAGTFMIYASHIAAMAPGTNLGAASPVSITGGLSGGDKQKKDKSKDQKSTLSKKVTNDAIAYIRSLAEMSGREVKFAEDAVRDATSITAQAALKRGVIEYVATDLDDLFKQIHGKAIKVNHAQITLASKDISTKTIQPDWRSKLLAVITDPSVAYILLLIGIYGLFFEFANPGFVLPGVAGAIALVLALYAFQMLPISYAGLGLVVLGVIFMVAEAFVPSFGALGFGGLIAFVAGSVLLMDADLPGYQIAWPLIIAMSAVSALFFFIIVNMAVRSRNQNVVSGREALIGKQGQVSNIVEGQIQARIQGEIWFVIADEPLAKDDNIEVIASEGLRLQVKKINQ